MKLTLVIVAAATLLAGCSSTPVSPAVHTPPADEPSASAPASFPAPPGYVEAMQALGGRGSTYELVHAAEDTCLDLMQGKTHAQVVGNLAGRLQVDRSVAATALPKIKEYFCS